MPKGMLPSYPQAYAVQRMPQSWFGYDFFQNQDDIDIAFLGSSHIFNAIDAHKVQMALSQKLGRPAIVRMYGWGGAGYDSLFLTTRDLLKHHHVRLLVFYDENPVGLNRCPCLVSLFHWSQDARLISGLPLSEQGLYYLSTIIGMPHNLLLDLRPSLTGLVAMEGNHPRIMNYAEYSPGHLDFATWVDGFAMDRTLDGKPLAPLSATAAATTTGATGADALIYSQATKASFKFLTTPIPAWQLRFAQLFATLTQEHGVHIVLLYLPSVAEVHSPVVPERAFWPALFGNNSRLLGFPPAKLFNNLSGADISKLFCEPNHLNRNGQSYFTRLITPALLNLYETATNN